MGVVKRGRGQPLTLFAPGGEGENLDIRIRYADRVPDTKVGFTYGNSGHFGSFGSMRRHAERDAAEVRAVADDHQAAQAIGFSRGARAIVGALAEGPTLFERIALVIPPGGRAAGRYSSWLDSLPKRGEANSPQKSSLSVTAAIKGIWSEWHKRGPSSWAPIWRYCRRGQSTATASE